MLKFNKYIKTSLEEKIDKEKPSIKEGKNAG